MSAMRTTQRRYLPIVLCVLCATMVTLPAGNRTFPVQGHWGISIYQQPAIRHTGYDYAPSVLYDDQGYRMWWCGSAPSGNPYVDHIWTAESEDGLNWNNIRVSMRPAPLALVGDPSVLHIGSLYRMYFTGTSDPLGSANQIYLATSSDGVLWTKWPDDNNPQPVMALPQGATGYGIGQPSVVYHNSTYWLFYTDTTREGGGTFLASSGEGTRFVQENGGHRLLATNSVDVKYSQALQSFLMVHGSSHDKLYFSSSTDGLHWEFTDPARYLALATGKNKAFEGCMAGSSTGNIGSWTYYYFASHNGTPGLIQDPLSWEIDVGRVSFSAMPPAGTVFQSVSPYTLGGDHLYDTRVQIPPLYDYEYRAFTLDTTGRLGLQPFYRLYHPQVQDHFYTADPLERTRAQTLGYLYEGVLGYVSLVRLPGYVPLYRLYHPRGDHFYTIDATERDRRTGLGYSDEGIAAFVWGVNRSGRPAAPGLWPTSFPSAGGPLLVTYDTTDLPGAYDIRLEMSYADLSFQSATTTIADPLARISVRLTGNAGVYRISTAGFQDGRYQIRIAAFDEAGLPVSMYSASSSFSIGAPPPPDYGPFGYIDIPAEGTAIVGPLAVEGWSLDDRGVIRVEVFIDGQSRGLAAVGRPRPDVRQVYPSYPNAEVSGFHLETNISSLEAGPHMILVEVTDTVGQKALLGPRMVTLAQGNNLPPFGYLDLPPEGSAYSGPMEIGGWALDDRGVSLVEMYVDGTKIANAMYGFFRPDVEAVFPGFPGNPNSGYTAAIDTAPMLPGTHWLMIRVIDSQGLITDMAPRAFTRP